MKRFPLLAAAVVLTVVLMSCPQPFTTSRSGDEGPTSFRLPADGISDTPRASGGAFTFETLFPVELALDVTLYGRDEDGYLADEPLDPALRTVNVSLTNSRGNAVYRGRLRPDGSLATIVYLASAPEDMTLTLSSAGFDSRTVTIARMVEFSRIERAMAIAQAPPGSRAASTIEFGDPDYQLNIPADGVLTIAFEDLFGRASAGDADYNDFIAEYSITETLDGETNEIVSIRVEAEAMVKLAGYTHAFGIRIDSFAGEARLTRRYIDDDGLEQYEESGPQYTLTAPVEVILFEHSGRAVGKEAWFELEFAVGQWRPQEGDKKQPPLTQPELSAPPYNPYIIVHNTGHDIHLIGREAITGSINAGDPFIDADGFPWALLVPRGWEHPDEGQRIEVKYPRFTNWRESNGEEHTDWYDWLYEPYVPPHEVPVVYIGGYQRQGGVNVAAYWVDDGEEVTRTDLASGDGAEVVAIYVDDAGVVYAAGYYRSGGVDRAAYWKDGQRTELDSDARASGIVVREGVVYVSGHAGDDAVTWRDDGTVTRRELHTTSAAKATGIAVDASGVVYVSGYYDDEDHNVAVYWRDSGEDPIERVDLYPDGLSEANAIYVDEDVYVAGRYLDGTVFAAYWVNDAAGLTPLTGDAGNAKGIMRRDGSIVAVGDYRDEYRRAAVWENGGRSDLPGSEVGVATMAYGLAVHEGVLYVSGGDGSGDGEEAVYWNNGVLVELAAGVTSRAHAILVRE